MIGRPNCPAVYSFGDPLLMMSERSKPAMPSKRDTIAELADTLIHLLESQRALGPSAYPLSVRRLHELAQHQASPAQIAKAIGKRSFQKQVILARAKNRESPLALASDLESLAGSRLLLEFMLQSVRTPANQAFSIAQLKAKMARKLQAAFRAALERQIDDGALPPTVGWITISRTKKLFLLTDLHVGRPTTDVPTLQPSLPFPIRSAGPPAGEQATPGGMEHDFAQAFGKTFDELDRASGGHNFVSLVALRAALPMPRMEFDRGLQQLRQTGHYGLSAAEGRHGLTAEERAAAIMEDGSLLLYVSRKMR
jgi:hypothetical protein